MIKKLLLPFFLLVLFFGCTRLMEEENAGENTFASNDGCVYCHTNEARLKVLAPPEDGEGGAGGG